MLTNLTQFGEQRHPKAEEIRNAITLHDFETIQHIVKGENNPVARKQLLRGQICTALSQKAPDLRILNYLISKGGDVNERTEEKGLTPLHFAACAGNVEICKILIKKGAQINAKAGAARQLSDSADPSSGNYPIHLAIEAEHNDIVGILINSGADVNVT